MEKETQKIKVRDIRDGDWYWIQRIVFEDYAPRIGVIGLALYNAYASYARDKGVAFPSQKVISEKLGISIKTVIKYNKILQTNGLIRIEKGKGKGKTNLITLLRVENMKQGKLGTEPSSIEVVKQVQTERKEMKENKKKEKESSLVNEIFRYFREAVGNCKGFIPEFDEIKDEKLIRERLKNYSLEEIKELIDWYLNSEVSDKIGVSISACLSAHVINLWKASRGNSIILERLYPKCHQKE